MIELLIPYMIVSVISLVLSIWIWHLRRKKRRLEEEFRSIKPIEFDKNKRRFTIDTKKGAIGVYYEVIDGISIETRDIDTIIK